MLIESFRRGVDPGERLTAVEWMSRNVVIPHSARNTQFDPSTAPWILEPIAEISKDSNDEILICAPVGSGKTTLFEALLAWIVAENPGPTLVTGQTDKTAKQWAESRLGPMLGAIPVVSKLFPKDRHKKRKTEILFPHMPLFIGGANLTSLQEKSIRWAIADEVWRWKPGMLEEFRRRTHDRWNARRILVSQGGEEGDDFHDAEDLCEKREFSWQCESCKNWKAWDFADIKFERSETGVTDWGKVSTTARMVCPSCKDEYPDDPRIRRRLASASKYIVVATGAPARIAFHYDASAVWWIPWGSLAVEWVKADQDRKSGDMESLKQFIQKRNARRWEEAGTGASEESVLRCRGQYLKGRCPIEPLILTMCCDVGQHESHWSTVAWAMNGDAFVIDYGTITGIEDILEVAKTQIFASPSGKNHFITNGLIDSGFNASAVYRVCSISDNIFFPAKGSRGSTGTISASVLKDYPNMPLYAVNEFYSKVALFIDRIEKRKAPFLFFPADSDEDFLQSFCGQKIVTNTKTGRKEFRAVARDHYADTVRLHYGCIHELRKQGLLEFST
jgi:phage terminase large subunit GpA-like protein